MVVLYMAPEEKPTTARRDSTQLNQDFNGSGRIWPAGREVRSIRNAGNLPQRPLKRLI